MVRAAGDTRRAARHFLAARQLGRALALLQDRVVNDFLRDPALPAPLDLSMIDSSLLADAPERALGLATDLLLSGDVAGGGEYLDVLLTRAEGPQAQGGDRWKGTSPEEALPEYGRRQRTPAQGLIAPATEGLTFDLVVSKLSRPSPQPGTVHRSGLIERLAEGESSPIALVVAPAGYGKTTLLAQWAERDGRSFAWVSLDERDNDPRVLLTYVAVALDRVEPIGERVFDALAHPENSVLGAVVPRIGRAFWSMSSPVVLVLDDAQVLHDSACWAALSMLANHVPNGSRLVLASRTEPPLYIAQLRAAGKVLQVGPDDLVLTREDAASLLRNAGAAAGEDDATVLHRRTQGWPAGMYLAALHPLESRPAESTAASFGGGDRAVSEYMQSEFLAGVSSWERTFLTHTAVLERMCGPLCDVVLQRCGSTATLEKLAQSNMLLVPDQQWNWYRYHDLLRAALLAEMERQAPELLPVLRRRAARWCLRRGLPEEALEYFIAAGDAAAAARLVERMWIPAYRQGRIAAVQRWLRWLDERGGIAAHPMVVAAAAFLSAMTAQPADAERWADVIEHGRHGDPDRPADPATEEWAAVLRAMLCRDGVAQMRADADEAARRFAKTGFATAKPALLQGIARVLSGDLDGGDSSLEDAVTAAEKTHAPEILAIALCERSLVAMARGEWSRAEVLAGRADTAASQAGIEKSIATLLVCAVQARAAVHRGDFTAARQNLDCARRQRPDLTYALPHLAVQARIELTRACIALSDLPCAMTLLTEIDKLFRRRPGLGTLVGEAQELRAQISRERGAIALGASALTEAELRLLPKLATHLSFPEIAEEMYLSPHTVKSEAISIYRKLGCSSRSEAVLRSRNLGLLDTRWSGASGGGYREHKTPSRPSRSAR